MKTILFKDGAFQVFVDRDKPVREGVRRMRVWLEAFDTLLEAQERYPEAVLSTPSWQRP